MTVSSFVRDECDCVEFSERRLVSFAADEPDLQSALT